MNTNENSACAQFDLVRDYAFDELSPTQRTTVQQHLAQCPACAEQLDGLRLTTAALRILPDLEPPRRIAFVAEPEPNAARWANLWNFAARAGVAAACLLAVGLSFAAYRRTAEPPAAPAPTLATAAPVDVDAAVNKAVALAVEKTHAEDVQLTKTALDAVEAKYAQKQQNLMVAMSSNLEFLQKSYQRTTRASYTDGPRGASYSDGAAK